MNTLRKAVPEDIRRITLMAGSAAVEMSIKRVCVWKNDYPFCHFEDDIAAGRMWVLEDTHGNLLAAFSMSEDEAGLENISWRYPAKKALHIERLVIRPVRDLPAAVIDLLHSLIPAALSMGADSLRLLELSGSIPAATAYKLAGFRYAEGDVGAVRDDRSHIRRDCFEMKI